MPLPLIATRRRVVAGIAASLAVPTAAFARTAEVYTGLLSSTAVGGYDAVAYFTEGKPVVGKKDNAFVWKSVMWRFATEKNRDAFKEKPEAYAPQYGGYCAWAVSQGYTAKGDPKAWTVFAGKLYFNYDLGVKKTWEKDIPGNIAKGDKNWPSVLDK